MGKARRTVLTIGADGGVLELRLFDGLTLGDAPRRRLMESGLIHTRHREHADTDGRPHEIKTTSQIVLITEFLMQGGAF